MKKLSSSRHFKSIVALAVGTALLVTAAAASYASSGGYHSYKQALKQLITRDSASISVEVLISYDGNDILSGSYLEEFDRNGAVVSHTATQSAYLDIRSSSGSSPLIEEWRVRDPNGGDYDYKAYYNTLYDADSVDLSDAFSSDMWTIQSTNYIGSSFVSEMYSAFASNEQALRLERVVESLADLLVGDLRNNFISTGSEDGCHSYRIAITEDQLPEIVRTGIEFLWGEMSNTGNRSIYYKFDYSTLTEDERDALLNDIRDLRNHTGDNIVVVLEDRTLVSFPTYADYYMSDYCDRSEGVPIENLFSVVDGTPRISTAECDFTVDSNGDLTYNRLYGEMEMCDILGERHTLALDIAIDVNDIPADGIAAPEISKDAYITDYSYAPNRPKNSYSITRDGITVYYDADQDALQTELRWFNSIGANARIEFIAGITGIEVDYDTVTAESLRQLFTDCLALEDDAGKSFRDYAANCGLTPEELLDTLLYDIENVFIDGKYTDIRDQEDLIPGAKSLG